MRNTEERNGGRHRGERNREERRDAEKRKVRAETSATDRQARSAICCTCALIFNVP